MGTEKLEKIEEEWNNDYTIDDMRDQCRRNVNLLRPRGGYDHWWRRGSIKAFFEWLWYAPKRIWQRCKYGWCGYDLWDVDHYFLWTLITALRKFADSNIGFPCQYYESYEDNALERWTSDIRAEADLLEEIFFEEQKWSTDIVKRKEKIKKALDWIAEYWFALWW